MTQKNFLAKLREEAGYKTVKITKELGISRTTLYLMEQGRRDITVLEAEAICKLYNITRKELEKHYGIRTPR